ncbi:MAG: Mg2+ and Co2+ transporter [Bdellovibrio sp.]|nr:MAG: Mg2+ and Co2+ transporter [Bdellovibrio sp.]
MAPITILAILVLCLCFLCSFLEGVFLSITATYVALAVKEGRRHGRLLEHLKENVDRPLSAILTLNTIANTIGSSSVGALTYELYGNAAVSVVSTILGFAVLVLGEFVPKVLGTVYWKQTAALSAYAIQFLIFVLSPIVWLAETLGRLVKRPETTVVTREEMIATAELGVEEGALHRKESAIIKNLLTLNSLFVSDIMTPRSVCFALEGDMTVAEVHQKHKPLRFSRIPVYIEDLDHVIGVTMRYRIQECLSNDQDNVKIKDITTPISTVSERMTVAGLLDFFIRKKEHLALVVDEYGIVTGLVTLEDAIETLLGVEIVDELDNVTDMRQYALEQWQIRKNKLRRT